AQIGGTERVVWMTTQQDPSRIDVIAQVNRSQPKVHELPEPIAHVSGHPQRDVLVCLGRDSGSVYIVTLEGRVPLRMVDLDGMARADAVALVAGPALGVVAARAGQPIGVFALDGRGSAMAMPSSSSAASLGPASDDGEADPQPRRSTLYDSPFGGDDEASPRRTIVAGSAPTAQTAQTAQAAQTAQTAQAAPSSRPIATFATPERSAPVAAALDADSAPARTGLASLQLRGATRPPDGTRQRKLGSDAPPPPPAAPEPKPRGRVLTDRAA